MIKAKKRKERLEAAGTNLAAQAQACSDSINSLKIYRDKLNKKLFESRKKTRQEMKRGGKLESMEKDAGNKVLGYSGKVNSEDSEIVRPNSSFPQTSFKSSLDSIPGTPLIKFVKPHPLFTEIRPNFKVWRPWEQVSPKK
jgi:hypothetical protein